MLLFRREKNICGICWYAVNPVDFQLSGSGNLAGMGQGITDENICCAYGRDGQNTNGFDCLIFPDVVTDTNNMRLVGLEQCGRSNGLVNMGQRTEESDTVTTVTTGNLNRTLCSKCYCNQIFL